MSQIIKLFANPTLAEILSIMFLQAEEEFYQSDLAKRTCKGLIQVQRALKVLEEIGLISSTRRGRMIYYKLVSTHPAYTDLKNLFLKTLSLGESILNALSPLRKKILFAFIFGSLAKGAESVDSDIDLFIIGSISLREIAKLVGPLSRDLKRELNPVVFESHEFKNKVSKKDPFLLDILYSPKIWIIGDDKTLGNLA